MDKNQVDYTNIHWAPVINCVVSHGGKILIVKRSNKVGYYQDYWNGISGFLDDDRTMKEKVIQEIEHELGVGLDEIESMQFGEIFHEPALKYKKTWIVHPVLVELKNNKIEPNWETDEYKWVYVDEIDKYKLLPGFKKVVEKIMSLKQT
ncbi:MAG: NUDIX domain-containing protein [Candidatus Moranbacteria bacterium]|nr:NUDIX domain-containing protein [Candidatus Moranbacteria bacterium]